MVSELTAHSLNYHCSVTKIDESKLHKKILRTTNYVSLNIYVCVYILHV